ncbi:MAG: hypothetical protein AB7P20_05270 [Rhizobiaceae bacterium]
MAASFARKPLQIQAARWTNKQSKELFSKLIVQPQICPVGAG